jgi:hypothetical protein
MFTLQLFDVPLFEAIASYCRLKFHSYLPEVVADGSVLGGMEIGIFIEVETEHSQTHILWGVLCVEVNSQ